MQYFILIILLFPFNAFANIELYESEKSQYTDYLNYNIPHGINGISMAHLDFKESDVVDLYPNHACTIGDVCSFECLADRCIVANEFIYKQITKMKYVKGEGVYYWFVGRPDVFPCPDKPWLECVSNDSVHTFGWMLRGTDFRFNGEILDFISS